MRYLKSLIAGFCFAVVLILAYALISYARSYQSVDFGWGGFTSVEMTVGPLLLILTLLAFAFGFGWMFRRSRITH
jgi:hypothetical protein